MGVEMYSLHWWCLSLGFIAGGKDNVQIPVPMWQVQEEQMSPVFLKWTESVCPTSLLRILEGGRQCAINGVVIVRYLGFCLVMDHSNSSENQRWAIIYEMIKCRFYIQGNKSRDQLIYLVKVGCAAQILIGSSWSTNESFKLITKVTQNSGKSIKISFLLVLSQCLNDLYSSFRARMTGTPRIVAAEEFSHLGHVLVQEINLVFNLVWDCILICFAAAIIG